MPFDDSAYGDWTDEYVWVPTEPEPDGHTPEDEAWLAEQNEDADGDPVPDDVLDVLAEEALTLWMYQQGILPL